ncbi:MAG: NAD(P)/FAD-dependent oxidoreductase, partial [Nitrospinales bacterium]
MNRWEYDIIVVGAGMIGLSIAFRLKQNAPDLTIAVLGDPMNSLMASRAAAGMLAPFSECDQNDHFLQFCRESLDKYPQFLKEVMFISGLEVYFSDAGAIMPYCLIGNKWQERLEFFKEIGAAHEEWSVSEAHKKLPYLSNSSGKVIWIKEGLVNCRQLHDALATAASKLGVEILNHNVTGFMRHFGTISEAVTDAGLLKGKRFVLAGGSWSNQLGMILGVC